jgi:hypothetical protein
MLQSHRVGQLWSIVHCHATGKGHYLPPSERSKSNLWKIGHRYRLSTRTPSLAPRGDGGLQRLPFSSAYRSPAITIFQRLPFSSDCHSPTPTHSPATTSACHSLAPTHSPATTSACHSPAPTHSLQRLQHPTLLQLLCALSFSGYFLSPLRD